MGDGRTEGLSAIGDGGQAAISLMPDVDGTDSGSLLDSTLSALLKKRSSDVWVPAFFFFFWKLISILVLLNPCCIRHQIYK